MFVEWFSVTCLSNTPPHKHGNIKTVPSSGGPKTYGEATTVQLLPRLSSFSDKLYIRCGIFFSVPGFSCENNFSSLKASLKGWTEMKKQVWYFDFYMLKVQSATICKLIFPVKYWCLPTLRVCVWWVRDVLYLPGRNTLLQVKVRVA